MAISTRYNYLEPDPSSSYRQLVVRGSRIRARTLYGLFVNAEEARSVEQIAADYQLPIEAVREAISYCESAPPEVALDLRRQAALEEAIGMRSPDYQPHGKPRLV